MPLTLDHEILTKEGWKKYEDIKRIKPGPDGKPVGENDELVCLDITDSSIVIEKFIGDVYLSKNDRVVYTIKNDKIDTSIQEDTLLIYKFNLEDDIKINTLVRIIYNMNVNKLDKFYLLTDSSNINYIEININELVRNIINTDMFSFITNKQTFYIRKNNLEFWTSS
uniref:Uncharacterized protein n=1 Tax=viral metagenome TaxID=1070528 RepID=A0A6C0HWW1_9ZZZZ